MTQVARLATDPLEHCHASGAREISESGKPRSSDLMAALAELERRFAVGDWRVAGIAIWPLLRLRWFFAEWSRHYAASGWRVGAGERLRSMLRGALASRRTRDDEPFDE